MKKAVLVFVLLSLVFSALTAFADDSKISPDLRGYSSNQQVKVIVQYAPGSQNSCKGLLGLVLCLTGDVLKLGGSILDELPLVNSLVATLDSKGILQLSNNANVVYISKDRPVKMLMSNAAPAVNAQVAWNAKYTGDGIAVALIDSGVNSHRDLSRVVYSQSFVNGKWSAADQYGHGTHIAGLIAGNGASSTGNSYFKTFKGIAPDARIVNLRVLDENGQGTDSAVIAAIHQAILLKSLFNIRVINLSLGRGVFESYQKDPLCQAVERAWKSGIVVVTSAGNYGRFEPTSGYGTITSPANDPFVITVGSMKPMGTPTRIDDLIASYSSKGPTQVDRVVKPDVVAPGNLLVSTETPNTTLYATERDNIVPYSYYTYGGSSAPSTSYFSLSGTSMAAGIVSGMVADLLDASPGLTPDQVKARLMKTASKSFPKESSVFDASTGKTYVSQYDLFTVGAGYVDLAAALASKDVFYGNAMSPVAVFNSNYKFYLARNPSSGWQSSGTWSAPVVYGPSQFNSGGSVMWSATDPGGSSVMWSAGNSSSFSTLWDESVMWSATNPDGASVMWSATNPDGSSVMWSATSGGGE
jgi:serine protease AprX